MAVLIVKPPTTSSNSPTDCTAATASNTKKPRLRPVNASARARRYSEAEPSVGVATWVADNGRASATASPTLARAGTLRVLNGGVISTNPAVRERASR